MWGYFLLLCSTVFFGGIAYNAQTSKQAQLDDSEIAALAGNMLFYRKYVTAYAVNNPSATGAIADASLSLPSWFSHNSNVLNYVSGGIGYVYITTTNQNVAYQIVTSTKSRVKAGIKSSGKLINPVRTEQIALPTAIPDGSTVAIQ